MPATKDFTIEDDITITISTVIAGLMAKYHGPNGCSARDMFLSILGNTAISINERLEHSQLSEEERTVIRAELQLATKNCLAPIPKPANDPAPAEVPPEEPKPETVN